MNAEIKVNGEPYIPLAAVPFVTGGFFTICNVARMIADPEQFCDHRHATILSASRVSLDGRLVSIHHRAFQPLADSLVAPQPDSPPTTIAGVVVPAADLKTLLNTIVEETSAAGTLDVDRPYACWDAEAPLPPRVADQIRNSICTPLNRTALRKNSAQHKINAIRDAVDHIGRVALLGNVPFDPGDIPGRKRDFLRLLVHVDPKTRVSEANFDRHYAAKLGLRWRQGSKPKDAGPLLSLFGMNVQ